MSKQHSIKDKKSLKGEVFRFIITGLIAALISFIVYNLTTLIMKKCGVDPKSIGITITATATSFILSVIVNYILSNVWVYQNVDKVEMAKHKKRNFILFVILSGIGMGISMGVMASCKAIFLHTLNVNIDTWWDIKFEGLFKWIGAVLSSRTFWLYAFSYILNAVAGLIFNYFSRKKWLYKVPKEYGND